MTALSGTPEEVKDLLAAIPADHDVVAFIDIKAVLQDPDVKEALEQEGVLDALGPAAGRIQQEVNTLVMAIGDTGLLGLLRGPLDVRDLLNSLKPQGANIESESYGAFEILKLDVEFPLLTLKVAASLLDDTTAVFALGFSPESPSVDLVKAALDTVGGSKPSFLSDPAARQLVESVPQGLITVVARNCDFLGGLADQSIAGCTGLAMSAAKEGEDGVINGIMGFESPLVALVAAAIIKEEVAKQTEEIPEFLKTTEITQEGNLVRLKGTVDIREALSATLDLTGP